MRFDFSGYATKNNLRCTDGVTIRNGAFSDCDGKIVPLVWQHLHDDPSNVLGKAFLEHREDGTYCYCQFNNTERAKTTKELVRHGDINSLSIYATKVEKRGTDVVHGDIKEVSLVMAPANPGARIEALSIAHGDGSYDDIDDECIIRHSGDIDEYAAFDLDVEFYDQNGNAITHADDDDETIQEVFDSLSEKQKNAVYAIIGAALADGGSETVTETTTIKHSEGGDNMSGHWNAFENGKNKPGEDTLIHAETVRKVAEMTFKECAQQGKAFKTALQHAAATYGIENIELLFPDAKAVSNRPEFVKRRTEWVNRVISGTKHTPFSRIKSLFADITEDEARAKGYIKGKQKLEEVFPVMRRVTTPQTIYKKQKLDHDDILDITDFDVVAWLRAEMRIMLEEEIARAILIGDGRTVTAEDKINENNIRPIWTDDPFYSYKLQLPANASNSDIADAFVKSRIYYEGSGRPECFTSPELATELMLEKDKDGYRMYKTETELRDALRVSAINEVPLFYNKIRTDTTTGKQYELLAIVVNLNDYSVGADKGGEITNFDDFDIDYNQYKYLIETRISGALTAYHGAIVIEREVSGSAREGAASANVRAR